MQARTFAPGFAERTARWVAAGYGVVAVFQLLLTLGAPWGRATMGGYHAGTLPPGLRVVTLALVAFYVAAGYVVLRRAGQWGNRFSRTVHAGTWALVVVLALGAFLNLASSSPWERFGWAPFALILGTATFVVARGRSREPAAVIGDRSS
jgi:hypothetical protein